VESKIRKVGRGELKTLNVGDVVYEDRQFGGLIRLVVTRVTPKKTEIGGGGLLIPREFSHDGTYFPESGGWYRSLYRLATL